jgi:hypothetical protein
VTGTLAILTHAEQGLDPGYFLAAIAEQVWRPAGWTVLVHQGLRPPPPAEIALLHVDLTRVPPAYAALARHYPRRLNAGVLDIAKRRVADGLVAPGDGYDGPVIVKTDLNHGGLPERRLRRGLLARLVERLPGRWSGRLPAGAYRVYARRALVPAWVWRRPELVVQRFLVERHGPHYALHQWFFLGEASVVSTLLADQPLVKWQNRVGSLPLHDDVPVEIRRRRVELGFDYGKFDYVVQDGRAWLLDANTTPHLGASPPWSERQLAVLRRLGGGLDSLPAKP